MNQFNPVKRPRTRMGKSTILVTFISLLLGHVAALNKKAVAQQIQPPAAVSPESKCQPRHGHGS